MSNTKCISMDIRMDIRIKFEVFTAVKIQVAVVCVLTPGSEGVT